MTKEDALYSEAVDLVIRTQSASVARIQRRLFIGFAQAASFLDEMQAMGIVSPPDYAGRRTVLKKDPPTCACCGQQKGRVPD